MPRINNVMVASHIANATALNEMIAEYRRGMYASKPGYNGGWSVYEQETSAAISRHQSAQSTKAIQEHDDMETQELAHALSACGCVVFAISARGANITASLLSLANCLYAVNLKQVTGKPRAGLLIDTPDANDWIVQGCAHHFNAYIDGLKWINGGVAVSGVHDKEPSIYGGTVFLSAYQLGVKMGRADSP